MVRVLPRRSGWDNAWLLAFRVDAWRQVGRLLGRPFCNMEVRLAVNLLGNVVAHSKVKWWIKDPAARQEM